MISDSEQIAELAETLLPYLGPSAARKAVEVALTHDGDREEVVSVEPWTQPKGDARRETDATAHKLVALARRRANCETGPQRFHVLVYVSRGQDVSLKTSFMLLPPEATAMMRGDGDGPPETLGLAAQAMMTMRVAAQGAQGLIQHMVDLLQEEVHRLRAELAASKAREERLCERLMAQQERTVGVIERHITAAEAYRDKSLERDLRIKQIQEGEGFTGEAWGFVRTLVGKMMTDHGIAPDLSGASSSAVVGLLKQMNAEDPNMLERLEGVLSPEQKEKFWAAMQSDASATNRLNGKGN